MLGFTSDFAVVCRARHVLSPQMASRAPIGRGSAPYGESHTGHGRSSVHKAEEGDAFERQLASDGWAYCAPNRGHLGLR